MLLEAAPLDTATFLATPALLVAAALAACLTPAFRASLIPPMTALRYEQDGCRPGANGCIL